MNILRSITLPLILLVLPACTEQSTDPGVLDRLIVYKNPSCSCCIKWAEYMENSGFKVQVENQDDLSGIKREFDLKPHQQSCHTAVWQAGQMHYFFEGHIPADIIRQFMDNIPKGARGLTVPGMPVGSPGMEYNDEHSPYDVILLKRDGTTEVYAHVDAK